MDPVRRCSSLFIYGSKCLQFFRKFLDHNNRLNPTLYFRFGCCMYRKHTRQFTTWTKNERDATKKTATTQSHFSFCSYISKNVNCDSSSHHAQTSVFVVQVQSSYTLLHRRRHRKTLQETTKDLFYLYSVKSDSIQLHRHVQAELKPTAAP